MSPGSGRHSGSPSAFGTIGIQVMRALALLLACCGLVHASGVFEINEVAAGVFVHRGRHVGLDDPARGDSANIGFVVGAKCVAVIDTGGSVDTGRALLAAIHARTARPICYVIDTHGHFDHVLGNAAFDGEGAEFVAHAGLPAVLAASADYFVERFADALRDGARTAAVTMPTRLVETTLVLDLGDRRLELAAVPPAHTGADLTVLDATTGTLFTGDLVFMERLPVLDGDLRGWLAWMVRAREVPVRRIVPGHGPDSAPWPGGGDAQRDYLERVLATARKAVAAGEFLDEVVGRAQAAPPAGWRVTEPHARNVSKAYRELEWE